MMPVYRMGTATVLAIAPWIARTEDRTKAPMVMCLARVSMVAALGQSAAMPAARARGPWK